jgi:ATPase subunit of ABC transporter with duplicated ATPase domains
VTAEFIYTCFKLGRFYPPDRQVLADISLSFYPGAKIGVLGANGSGKSSLLRRTDFFLDRRTAARTSAQEEGASPECQEGGVWGQR